MGTRAFIQQLHAHEPPPGHPERPERLEACLSVLQEFADAIDIKESRTATREELARAHRSDYLDALERFCDEGGGRIDQDTYATSQSFETAASASGAFCEAVEYAVETMGTGFCVVRPPGHHSGSDYAMGFCLINHAAVGVHRALAMGVSKVYIVDFDVHHGNGTQDIFWNDERVLYLSIHQSNWYPGTGALDETGGPDAHGMNVNIPLPASGGDATYLSAFDRLVLPIGRQFRPDLLVVSAGFDAHARDPLALMEVSTEGFGEIASRLVELAGEVCDGAMAWTLEGGYDLEALSSSLAGALQVLTGKKAVPSSDAGAISPELDKITAFHSALWRGVRGE
jgi:acetoin utilization deacetylase AcuC-like enzyme